jgi:hypothetical protein
MITKDRHQTHTQLCFNKQCVLMQCYNTKDLPNELSFMHPPPKPNEAFPRELGVPQVASRDGEHTGLLLVGRKYRV